MGYRIEYTPKAAIRRPAKWPGSIKYSLVLGILSGTLLGLWAFFPGLTEAIRQALLPGTQAVTAFVDNLESGTGFAQAVTVFCQELFNGA